jgi:hypothetical protein
MTSFYIACKLSFCQWRGYFRSRSEAQEEQHTHWAEAHPGVPFVTTAPKGPAGWRGR